MRFGVGAGLVAITVLAFACAMAPAAQADLTWSSSSGGISPTGTQAHDVHVATDAAGDAVAVWLQHDGATNVDRVAEARRPAGKTFGPWSYISGYQEGGQDSNAEAPAVSMNAEGDVIVVWDQWTGHTYNNVPETQVYYSWQPAGRSWAPVQPAYPAAVTPQASPQVGLDSAGDAVLVWQYDPNDAYSYQTVAASYRLAGDNSQFTQQDVLTSCPNCSNGSAAEAPQLAVNATGDAVVTYVNDHDPEGISSDPRVDADYLPAGGDEAHWPQFGQETSLSTDGDTVSDPAPAIDAAGDGLVVWEQGVASGTPHTEAAYRPAAQGSFTLPAQTLSTTEWSYEPQAAFDPSGDAYAIWAQSQSPTAPGPAQIVSAYRPAGASSAFGGPGAISPSGQNTSAPEIGIDGQGRPAALWVAGDSSGVSGNPDTVQASSSDAGGSAWAAPSNLSSPGDLGLDTGDATPQLSVSSGGQAVGVWQQSDGSELMAQAAFGAPPGAGPPPTQLPPAPIPEAINAAAPFQPGKAIVLTVTVEGDATHLQWSFSDSNATVESGIVDGHLQRSVRLRPTERNLTVKVTATGPGGSKAYSRTFLLSQPPSDPDGTAVRRALDGLHAPPVFGVGDAQDLLGNTACGPITVYAGQQTVSGCMRPINAASDIPGPERGAIQTMANSLGLNPNDPGLMNAAVSAVDGYVGVGPTTLNHTWPVDPTAGASVISIPAIGALTSSHASLDVGGIKFGGLPGGFSLNVNPLKADIPLGSLPKPSLPDIGGFPLVGNWNVDLGSGAASIDAHLQLPSWLNIGGIPLQVPVSFKATPSGLVLDRLNVGPIDVNIGPLAVKKFQIAYDRASDTWTGSGQVCVLTGACLDMSPPNGEVKIVNGSLNYAGATLVFPEGSGIPLFAGVDLNKIGFGLGLDPTRIIGRAGISVLDLVQLDGELVVAFPTADHPFVLRRDEVGSDFPAADYGPPFTEPTIGASADVSLNLPDVGYVKLGQGYLLFEIPDYIALGGGFNINVLGVVQLYGNISGAANFRDGTLDLGANAGACLLLIGKICASAVVNISRAPNDGGGAGGCVDIAGFNIGGGVLWNGPKVLLWPFDGCRWSRFKVDVKPSLASAAAATQTIVVKRGAPNPALELHGDGAAPLVRVTGPGGQALDSTDKGFDYSPGGHIRILRYEGQTGDFTIVGLEHAQPGTYTVSTLPGSVPFTEIDSATDPPAAHVTANVTGTGAHRVLTYDVRPRPDQTVVFSDLNTGGAQQKIGTVHGGGQGHISFTPAPGRGRRSVVARFTLAGLPAERMTVAHFRPPKPELPTPRGLRLTRHRKNIDVTWLAVPGATHYEVVLTDRTTGYQRLTVTRHHTLTLTRVALTVGGTITVRALDQLRQSLTARATIKRLSNPASRFQRLGRCKLGKKKITCKGGPPAKRKPKPRPKHRKKKRSGHK
jgi:hypothetical protein